VTLRSRYLPKTQLRRLTTQVRKAYVLQTSSQFKSQNTSQMQKGTMYELIIHPGPKVEVIDSPIPVPNDDQVVIKVIVSGCNPKDWKRPEWFNVSINQGDDIAGIVHQVGKNVTEFKVC
jgi:hypothetical protein